MRISGLAGYALGVVSAAALIAGCSGAPQSSALAPSTATSATRTGTSQLTRHGASDTYIATHPYPPAHTLHRKTWVSPGVARLPRILFASDDGNNTVNIYSMPDLTLMGQITGLSEPQGLCSDSGGNIYVANTSTFQVLKYSRTGSLLATYNDTYGYPVGCAVDPATNNLAVTDIFGFSGAGQVLVFSSPSAQPTVLSNPNGYYYFFAGYGPGSDLWVSGRDEYGNYQLSACGGSSCSTIPLSGGTIYFPGAVQYDRTRSTWVAFDQLCGDTTAACSYPVSPSGVLGSPTTYLNYNGGPVCDMVQGVIAANGKRYVAGGDYEYCGAAASTNDRWGYTAGGTPTNYTTINDNYAEPIGAAVSTK